MVPIQRSVGVPDLTVLAVADSGGVANSFARMAIGGTRTVSPAPRSPNGWRGFDTSMITVSIKGGKSYVDNAPRAC